MYDWNRSSLVAEPMMPRPNDALAEAERIFNEFFAESPTPAWIMDWSQVGAYLRDQGIEDGRRWDMACKANPGIPFELPAKLRLVICNEATLRMAGLASFEDLERVLPSMASSLPDDQIRALARAYVTGAAQPTRRLTMTHSEKPVVEFLLHWVRPPYLHGSHLALVIAVDESEETRRRRELELSEERYRRLVEDQSEFVVRYEAGGIRIFVNESYCEHFGKTRDELIGKSFLDLVAESDRATVEEKLHRLVPGGPPIVDQHQVIRPDGSVGWHEWTDRAIRRPDGTVEYLAVGRDITERVQARQALERALAEVQFLRDQLAAENRILRHELRSERGLAQLVGESPAMRAVKAAIDQVGRTDATVLIHGETGTGKELVADAVHAVSGRCGSPLIKVNCAAISAGLIESELFGHEKGAFTGAHMARKGRFEIADGGTLFLDEVGELPVESQAKLLRVLQEGQFEAVGSSATTRVNVRIIAATNRDLQAEVAAGRFRADLFYRLNVFPIHIPPLRERRDDIPRLAHHLVRQLGSRLGRSSASISNDALDRLTSYEWPGNVRELANTLERAIIVSRSEQVSASDLPPFAARASDHPPREAPGAGTPTVDDAKTLDEVARDHIVAVLRETEGVIGGDHGAARRLGVNESTLRSRMKKLGISPAGRRGPADR